MFMIFFFSSRRRHTRLTCDWSSDVCSSDLPTVSCVVLAQNDTTHETVGPEYNGQIRHLGNAADCWIDWSPDGTALFGGSPDGCTGTVIVPVDDPSAAFTTYTPMAGVTSWQPLETP